jgi:hypothetical protein
MRKHRSQQQYGNRVTVAATTGAPLSMDTGEGGETVFPDVIGWGTRLITGNLVDERDDSEEDANELSILNPGSWVLELRGQVTDPSPAPGYGTEQLVAPLVARVCFGKGGNMQEVWVDAMRCTLALPSSTVYVDVGYLQTWGNAGGNLGVFRECAVEGSLHRSFARTRATFSLYTLQNFGRALQVPAYARAHCFLPFDLVAAADVITPAVGTSLWYAGPPELDGQQVEYVAPSVFASNARGHCFREIHPYADRYRINLDEVEGVANYPGTMIFKIDL